MSLDDALKARTLELISQQMATWVVEIQKNIRGHQEELVRTLDELQENVARYDEKIDEATIASAEEAYRVMQAGECLTLPQEDEP